MGTIEKRLLKNGEARYDARIHRRKSIGTKNGWQSKTFKTERDAKKWINAREAKIDEGGNVSKRGERVSFAEIAREYMAQAKPTKKQALRMKEAFLRKQQKENEKPLVERTVIEMPTIHPDEKRTINLLIEHWGEFRISAITKERVEGWMKMFATLEIKEPKGKKKAHPYFKGGLDKDGNKRTYSASTIRRHFFVFKKLLNWGAAQHGFQIDPKVFDVKPPDAWEGQRERRLSVDEEARLYEAITRGRAHKAAWASIITFALDTTARMQEILLARWSDIDEANRLWTIPKEHTKTGQGRKVPLTLASLECIKTMQKLREAKSERIFHQWAVNGGLSKAWKRLVARAKIEDLHYHDLRHEAVSRLFERTDLKDAEIMKISGHTTHEMLKGYLGLRETSVAARMDAMRRTTSNPGTSG